MMIIGHGLLNTRVVPFLVTGPVQQKPLPRAACAAFPSPWERGVNGLANNGLITVLQTLVGRWPPCPVLQQVK